MVEMVCSKVASTEKVVCSAGPRLPFTVFWPEGDMLAEYVPSGLLANSLWSGNLAVHPGLLL
jgi:hypothetical protein